MSTAGAASWDKEYAGGRCHREPPVAFVADILAAAGQVGVTSGLYIGCGAQGHHRQQPETGQWTQWEGIWHACQ